MKQKIAKLVTKAIVNTNHPLFDFRSKEAKKQTNWIRYYLKPYVTPRCRLIDLGCGTGKQSFTAEELGAKVCGIDCSREAIRFADRIKKEAGSDCQFIVADYTNLPFENNLFNVAIFPKNIIECSYREIEKLSIEVKRILKKSGKFVVTMKDELGNVCDNKTDDLKKYHLETGLHKGKIILPNKKQYSYPTYFWTIPFAKHIISNHLSLLKEKKIENNYHILIFHKNR